MRHFYACILIMFTPLLVMADDIEVDLGSSINLQGEIHNSQASIAVLMLHQCNRDQSMWSPLVSHFQKAGFATMTVDFRGYGKSKTADFNVDGTDQDYLNATQHVKSDVFVIYEAFKAQAPLAEKRVVIGASCGGGGAGLLAANHDDIDALVLFSPSMRDYWFPAQNWQKLAEKSLLPVLAIAAKQDTNALSAIDRVTDVSQAEYTEYIRYNGRLHGQPLFEFDSNLADKIVSWVIKVTR